MLRITLPSDSGLHPEISGGLHRCSIRFLRWVDAQTRSRPGDGRYSVRIGLLQLNP
jgi:cell division FtsZ-interacting protein ZapD